jgi:hypothetical protein
MTDTADTSNPQLHLLEAVAGWIVPGLGHWLLGERRRGVILGITILSLWLAGLLIGGVCVLDPQTPPEQNKRGRSYWYFAQIMVGPSVPVSLYFVNVLYNNQEPVSNTHNRFSPSLGKVNEQGTLYTAMAGLLNLLAVIDVVWCDPQARRKRRKDTPPPPPESQKMPRTAEYPAPSDFPQDIKPQPHATPAEEPLAGPEVQI